MEDTFIDYERPLSAAHKGTDFNIISCLPHSAESRAVWIKTIERFIYTLAESDEEKAIQIEARSAKNKLKAKRFINGDCHHHFAYEMTDLVAMQCNLVFRPQLVEFGEKTGTTKFGWFTCVGEEPFKLFPDPAIVWKIGSNAYQGLMPLPHEMLVDLVIAYVTGENDGHYQGTLTSGPNDLLYLPGSLIYKPGLPPYTAEIIKDDFTRFDPYSTYIGVE
jgi:hypothetical protein